MFKNAFVAVVVGGLLSGCGLAEMQVAEGEQLGEVMGEVRGCTSKCKKCPPGKICTMECQPVGNCGTTCTTIALCVDGYFWNEASCACEPTAACAVRCAAGYTLDDSTCSCVPNAGSTTCGIATCAAGTVCCNSSCGICTAPGGACIQLYCETGTL